MKESFVLLFSALVLFVCCSTPKEKTYSVLMEHANTVKIINTHEHQRNPADLNFEKYNFWTLLYKSYLLSDVISAGAFNLSEESINSNSLDELWNENSEYLESAKTTSYYQHFLEGLEKCYGYKEIEFTKEGIEILSEQIAEKYADYETWFDECFQKFNFETMFLDQYWANNNSDIDKSHFTFVLQTNSLVGNIGPAKLIYTNTNDEIIKLSNKSGVDKVEKLSDYLSFAEGLIRDAKENGAVALKNSQAYWRTLDYENVSFERADLLFEKSPQITKVEEKELQDFMFHWILEKGAKLNLPVQIHTGYLAGNGNQLNNGQPIKLNNLFLQHKNTKFDLFHGGFPWTGEFVALGKMFPNVYLNLVWLPQISKQRALVTFNEILDCVPYNKVLWGGDCHFIEETVGSLEFGKQVVCEVLANRVENGELSEETARKIITAVFRKNAIDLFILNMN